MSYFIKESAILQETQDVKMIKPNKARFRMVLQTVDEENQNHRVYPKTVLAEGLGDLRNSGRIENRAFCGELNHPLPTGNEQFDAIRQTTVDLERISHVITDYDIVGNKIIGEVETTSNDCGQNLLALLRDRIGLGMSLRAMAELNRNYKTGVSTVKGPIYIVGYDSVSNPSHKSAVVNFNEMRFEASMITENCDGVICYGGKCYLSNYFDKLIETRMIEFVQRWI